MIAGQKTWVKIVHVPQLAGVPTEIAELLVGMIVEFACRDSSPPMQASLPFPELPKARGYRVLGTAFFEALVCGNAEAYTWFHRRMFDLLSESMVFPADCCQEIKPP